MGKERSARKGNAKEVRTRIKRRKVLAEEAYNKDHNKTAEEEHETITQRKNKKSAEVKARSDEEGKKIKATKQ